MKMNFWKTAIATLCVAFAFTACHTEQKAVPSVSLAAGGAAFVNGEATVLVNLSTKAPSDVKVVLEAAGTLPDSNLEFEKSVTVPKGSSAATVSVKVKPDGLEAKSYDAVISIVSVTNGELGSPKSVTINYDASGLEKAVVNIDADSEFSAENKATVTISLRKAAAEDVSVKFAVGENVASGKTPIPAEALSFTNPAVVPAGSKELELVVTVDPTKIVNGKAYQADLIIESVSSNAKVGTDVEVFIDFRSAIVANLRNDWSVSFEGEYEQNGNTYHSVSVEGLGDEGTYYLFIYEKGTISKYFNSVSEYVDYMELEEIAPYIGTDDAYQIKSGDKGWLYRMFAVGEYEIWLLGCDSEGHITGDYTTSTFEIEPSAEQIAAYDEWLGEWEINHKTLVITENKRYVSYNITGFLGYDFVLPAVLNSDCTLGLMGQSPVNEDGTVGFFGIGKNEQEGYVSLYTNSVVGSATMSGDKLKATFTASLDPNGEPLTGVAFLSLSGGSVSGWYSSEFKFPFEMARPTEAVLDTTPEKDGAFADFIGGWSYNGYDLVIADNSSAEANTYLVSGIPNDASGSYGPFKAVFADGKVTIATQVLGSWTHQTYGECHDNLSAAFIAGDDEYRYFPFNGGEEGVVVATIVLHESGNFTIKPGVVTLQLSSGPVDFDVIGISYSWSILTGDNAGRGNWEDALYFGENVAGIRAAATPASLRARRAGSVQRSIPGSRFAVKGSLVRGEGLSTLR